MTPEVTRDEIREAIIRVWCLQYDGELLPERSFSSAAAKDFVDECADEIMKTIRDED